MKQLKVKDNSEIEKADFSEIPGVVRVVADRTLGQLEKDGVFVFPQLIKEADDITKHQMILQGFNDYYLTGNVMGFIGRGDERLTIESRFSSGTNDFFFQYLLERVLDFPNVVELETDGSRNDRMFALLLFLFPSYLSAALRKGLYKSYVRTEYNDENVRGTIDIPRHIRKNIPFVGKVAYNQREYAYDNYVMQLIRCTIEFIKGKPFGNKILSRVKDEINLVKEATPSYETQNKMKILAANKKTPVRHAYYHEYMALQRLCILILQNEKQQIGIGNRKVFGILFDGAWLWEEYINKLIGDFFYHPMNKARKGAQRLFAGGAGLIYPDFIGKATENRIIADAKYKPIDNIGNRDYLQVLAYMFRFDSKKAFYLYPETLDAEDKVLLLNSGSTYEGNVQARGDISVNKHGLKIPQNAESYEEFVEEIKGNEVAFKAVFD